MKLKLGRTVVALAVAGVMAAALSACTSVSTPTGMCGWVVGNGESGHDAKIKSTVWPDENVDYDTNSEVAHYVPCGPRNYIITDGGNTGDYNQPLTALTSSNTPVKVTIDALWQLNQDKNVLGKFAELCNKYECYTTDAKAGKENNATKGWNDMLQENFLPAIQDAVKNVMYTYNDDIWKKQDPTMLNEFEGKVSAEFMKTIQQRTGYNVNLFCGSGNSAWSEPNKAGDKGNTFTCTQVRFDSATVVNTDKQSQANVSATNQVQLDTDANKARYDKNVPLYGDQTHFWLGVQDSVGSCPSGATCNFYLGNIPAGQ